MRDFSDERPADADRRADRIISGAAARPGKIRRGRPISDARLLLIKREGRAPVFYIFWHDGERSRRRTTGTGNHDEANKIFARWLNRPAGAGSVEARLAAIEARLGEIEERQNRILRILGG